MPTPCKWRFFGGTDCAHATEKSLVKLTFFKEVAQFLKAHLSLHLGKTLKQKLNIISSNASKAQDYLDILQESLVLVRMAQTHY